MVRLACVAAGLAPPGFSTAQRNASQPGVSKRGIRKGNVFSPNELAFHKTPVR